MLTYEHDFAEFIQRRDAGEKVEIDEELYSYFMEVLPPVTWATHHSFPDGMRRFTDFGFAEGEERITAFWRDGARYFAQHTTAISRG